MKTSYLATILFAVFFALTSVDSFAQQVEVSGQVKSKETKENLPFCKVVALNSVGKVVQGGLTDDKGFFKLPVNPGMYSFVISSYGFDNDTVPPSFIREDSYLGVFRLEPTVVDIGEVEVKASSRIDADDRDIQVITDEQKQGSTAAKDVLDKVAGISYDDYTGVLKVDGSGNILILVNGVEKSQEYVQNLDPERLLRVETIRDPGGRYGLEGYSAIVNVILRRDYRGTEMYVEQMNLVDINTEQGRVDYMIGSLGATYNYTRNDLNIYAGARVERKNFKIYSESETNYDNEMIVYERNPGTGSNVNILEYGADYTLGLDYRINPKHIVSFESNISALPFSTEDNRIDYHTDVFTNGVLTDQFDFSTHTKSQSWSTYNSLFYIGDLNERNKLNINFTHSLYKDDYAANTLQENNYDRSETGTNQRQYTRFYAEYDHIFSPKTSIQVGYGNIWRELNNDFNVFQVPLSGGQNINAESNFRLTDIRHKLYSNYAWKFNKKWSTRIGLAVETSAPRVNDQQLNYVIYQPLFDLRYVAGKKLNFKLKYRTTSAYPGISETNPFLSQVNPRITSVGNPFLRPSTTHRFSLRTNIGQGLLAVEPYLHYSDNRIVNIGELDTNGMFNYRYENAETFQLIGGRLNFSKFFKFSMLIQANIDVYHAKFKSSVKEHSLMDWNADVDLIYIFQKTETLLGLKYQREQGKWITGMGYTRQNVDFWMLFYKQPLFKKRGSVMFGYFLPIDFGATYNQDSRVETTGFYVQTDNNISLVKNMFILEFSYRFSKGKVKRTEKTIDKESDGGKGGIF